MGSWPLHAASGGRLLGRAYPPGADPGICDSLIPQQGPNYALAKRVHRWRATAAREDGAIVSMNLAPPTRTRSVLKNRVLAAAYVGAPRFGVEVFEPATTKTLMAALLVHDLYAGRPGAGRAVAGRGACGRARRPVAHRLHSAQRAAARGAAGLPGGAGVK